MQFGLFSWVLCLILLCIQSLVEGGSSTTDCDGKISILKKEMTKEVSAIRQEMMEEVSAIRQEMTDKLDHISEENKRLKSEINAIKTETHGHKIHPRQINNSVIAFHAYVSHELQSIGLHHPIPFDTEMTDYGSGFNVYTGIYTVPVSGLYAFSWTITVIHTKCQTELIHNADAIGETMPDSEHDDDFDTATAIVIRQVNKGDSIFVKSRTACPDIRSNGFARSSFSGWKL